MKTMNILIIDDEPGMRSGVVKTLNGHTIAMPQFHEEIRFSVTEAETGNAGLDQLRETRVDIVLLDYKLPDILGLEVLNRLTDENIDVLTIMITAYASLEVAVSATKSGAFDFLAKPFTPAELKASIQKAATRLFLQWQAKQLAEEKRQVISVLAHELKSPINAVAGYLALMQDRVSGDRLDDYGDMIGRSLIRLDGMKKMIMDLLDLTRIESGNLKRTLDNVDLRQCADDAVMGVTPDAQKRQITISLDAPPHLMIEADTAELSMIFNNLLTNAVKYNQDKGRVRLLLAEKDAHVQIICEDTGIGISKEDQKRLFGEFVRVKTNETRLIEGSGLGLAILKKIVAANDGEITMESEPGKGTTFMVTLPKKQAGGEPA